MISRSVPMGFGTCSITCNITTTSADSPGSLAASSVEFMVVILSLSDAYLGGIPIRLDAHDAPTILPENLELVTKTAADLQKLSPGWVQFVDIFPGTIQIANLQALLFQSLRMLLRHIEIRIIRPRLDLYVIRFLPRIRIQQAASAAFDDLVDLRNAGGIDNREVGRPADVAARFHGKLQARHLNLFSRFPYCMSPRFFMSPGFHRCGQRPRPSLSLRI